MKNNIEIADSKITDQLEQHFKIKRLANNHVVLVEGELVQVGFGYGEKDEEKNPTGFYAFWFCEVDGLTLGQMVHCTEMKTKYDSIDYFWTLYQNAVESIIAYKQVKNGSVESPFH